EHEFPLFAPASYRRTQKRPALRLAVWHRLSGRLHPVLDPAVAGPAIARRWQRDVVLDQAVLEDRDAFGILALLALVLGRRCFGANFDAAVLAILVAQGLTVGRRIPEDADADHARLPAVEDDHDAAILRLTHTIAGLHHQIILAAAD